VDVLELAGELANGIETIEPRVDRLFGQAVFCRNMSWRVAFEMLEPLLTA
jgi:hypothetical protein